MSTIRHPRPSRHADDSPQLPPADDGALGQLLAAAAPPRVDPHDQQAEFRGERAAVQAFRQARFQAAAFRKRPRRVGAFAAKTVVAVAALSAVGGAVAASTGHLSAGPAGNHVPAGNHGSAPASSSAAPGSSTSVRSSAGSSATPGKIGRSAAVPSPVLQGLCRAYAAGRGSSSGKALDNPAFSALITAAGGKDKISSYCGSVLTSSAPARLGNSGSPGNSGNSQRSGNSQNSGNDGNNGNSAATGNGGGAHSSNDQSGPPAPQGQPASPATVAPTALPSPSSAASSSSAPGTGVSHGPGKQTAAESAYRTGFASAEDTACMCHPYRHSAGP
ncbi:MAG TPA: hypothetical protein VGG75_11860 [Trebonia sp.]